MSKSASADLDNGAMEPRLRKLELDSATMAQKIDSLFDNGSPGILSQIRNSLSDKIDAYCQTVTKFIEGEPARKAHMEKNTAQAVMDAKTVAKEAVSEAEKEQNRMHLENRRDAEKTDLEVSKLRDDFSRHEKFVQRGVGAVILGQVVLAVGGFSVAALTFMGGLLWWVFVHVPINK
jgi:hypothetical protein